MSDDALLHEFNRARSEQAFEALVQRHLELVFATALRQVGDRSLAEEISQQVFLALARKAGRLGGHQTIAGWLYQTTLREAKRALRTELRRQRRDQLALEVGALGHGSADDDAGLLPLLDEALASLRESERLAVILRYFEGKSWREVGTELGASEDAVQKRGERALETLGRFFARHGFKVSAATLTTGLTTQASAAVPVTLAGVITQTALVPAASASTVGVLAMHLMNLTKTQTTVATLLVCAAPIAYEVNAQHKSEAEMRALSDQFTQTTLAAQQNEARRRDLTEELASLNRMLSNLAQPLPATPPPLATAQAEPAPQRPVGWQDDLPFVEVSKAVLREFQLPAIGISGTLTTEIVDLLALTVEESTQVDLAIKQAIQTWRSIENARGRVEPSAQPINLDKTDYVESFSMRFPAFPEQGAEIRQQLVSGVSEALGDERSELLLTYASERLDELFSYEGRQEKLVTLVRTGIASEPIRIEETTFFDGQQLGTTFHTISTDSSGRPLNLNKLPQPLQSVATRWFYWDRKP